MKILEETDQRFKGIEKKIRLFVSLAVIGILVVIAFIQRDVFIPKTKIFFIADTAQGLSEGMHVKFRGFSIGKIKRLELDDKAGVKAELSIYSKYMKWIRQDSKATLLKEIIGESVVEITPGSERANRIADNGMIEFEREKGISGVVEELRDELMPILKDVRQLTTYFNDPNGEIKQILRNVSVVTKDASATRQHIDTVLKDADSLIKNSDKNIAGTLLKIDSILDSSKKTMSTVDGLITKLDQDMPPLIGKMDATLVNVLKTTEELKKVTEQTAPKIPSIVGNGADIAEGTKDIVDSVKKMWPIRTFIKTPMEKTLKTDSYE